MAIKNLLVVFNDAKVSESALKAALQMQQKYDAHLTGLLVHYGDRDKMAERWLPENVRGIARSGVTAREAQTEARFRQACEGIVPTDKTHWIAMSGSPDDTIVKYAVMYDVVIAGQHCDDTEASVDIHPERIALNSARPVIVVPTDYDEDAINRRAVIAWDGRKSATRVLYDAMQILETKAEVDVVSSGEGVYKPENCIDVVTALSRHGVTAERVRLTKQSRKFGAELLAYCNKVNAGIVIIGVYEKGVLREEIFGGATSHVLKHAKIPVVISH